MHCNVNAFSLQPRKLGNATQHKFCYSAPQANRNQFYFFHSQQGRLSVVLRYWVFLAAMENVFTLRCGTGFALQNLLHKLRKSLRCTKLPIAEMQCKVLPNSLNSVKKIHNTKSTTQLRHFPLLSSKLGNTTQQKTGCRPCGNRKNRTRFDLLADACIAP